MAVGKGRETQLGPFSVWFRKNRSRLWNEKKFEKLLMRECLAVLVQNNLFGQSLSSTFSINSIEKLKLAKELFLQRRHIISKHFLLDLKKLFPHFSTNSRSNSFLFNFSFPFSFQSIYVPRMMPFRFCHLHVSVRWSDTFQLRSQKTFYSNGDFMINYRHFAGGETKEL
jgi:hypothetical protein